MDAIDEIITEAKTGDVDVAWSRLLLYSLDLCLDLSRGGAWEAMPERDRAGVYGVADAARVIGERRRA